MVAGVTKWRQVWATPKSYCYSSHFGSDSQNKQNLIWGASRGDYLGQHQKAIAILVTLEVTAKTSRI
jgi:hypothetical protein